MTTNLRIKPDGIRMRTRLNLGSVERNRLMEGNLQKEPQIVDVSDLKKRTEVVIQ